MYKLIIMLVFCSLLSANELSILKDSKKQLRQTEKQRIEEKYNSANKDWIAPITISSGIKRGHSFSSQSDNLTKSVSIGFTQSIYKSGGIEFTIKNAKDVLNSDLINWEIENNAILETIYETLLQIKQLKIQIEQNKYSLKNKEIQLELKKIQYEAGNADITELNNAIIDKNSQFKQNIATENALKDKEYELSKYTNLKYDQIELLDFKGINKKDFINNNLNIKYEKAQVESLDSSYKKLKSTYLPQVTLGTSYAYSKNNDMVNDYETSSKDGSISLNVSMPIYDINKSSTLEESRLSLLKQKLNLNDIKEQIKYEYDQILNQIDTYEKQAKVIKDNLNLYTELINANKSSNDAGMSADYDLEILQNTKKINEYDLSINQINIKLQYSKLYFKTRV
ncbi:outer membrane efflux protein [Arcobacter nitrofigilis DSM 7299]|uniref:Outer membrane efflux protein n=1 Tax=Arcobacter nitrofigilis (strain ATCC 33309 / DSM 7299 / CCUG 15893 / LMG 7604 / NCTC 12251 / CI) TaxID=572480 RepID=D5V5K2_ARCNC|nr:TolC family protein [Arcobacter nitrofigilis]ADG92038.1 outer membrane efflux protein [Arcobacter nitrofigilis DSM 7299]